jgi:AraC-like DNA-binding protein
MYESLEQFYKQHFDWMPADLKTSLGHFNVFKRNIYPGPVSKDIQYFRRGFFKICLLNGRSKIYYGDQAIIVEESALFFVNPQVPYGLELLDTRQSGFFCLFTEEFFANFMAITDYPLFKPGQLPVLSLTELQKKEVSKIFIRMLQENNSDFRYKYDRLRNLVIELTLLALELLPVEEKRHEQSNGLARLSSQFVDLLERQFPVTTPIQQMELRSPVDFSEKLAVHVNYLNKSLKEITGKTTSQLIGERIVQEAKSLLIHTNWDISEIAGCLGYADTSHFVTSFKKCTTITPALFRRQQPALLLSTYEGI